MAKIQLPITEPKGKLGVMTVGLGAVATTMIAGVEAVRRGLAAPVGSLTQMGTIRLGKRTDARVPKIKDFVPLANLEDLVFGSWDIFADNAYEAAVQAGVLEHPAARAAERLPRAIQPMQAVFDAEMRSSGCVRTHLLAGKTQDGRTPELIAKTSASSRELPAPTAW